MIPYLEYKVKKRINTYMRLNELMKPIKKMDRLDSWSMGYGGFNSYEKERNEKLLNL
jgi:hypothetical protein